MSVRPVRLLCVALLGVCLIAPTTFAKNVQKRTHSSHHSKKKAVVPKGPVLVWRGDITSARSVVDDVIDAWGKEGHGSVQVESFNTASGLDAVSKGSADLAGSARGSNGSPAESTLTFTPVAWDALVVITHPANPVSNLTLTQLHDIYYGKITNWNQVGGPDALINVYAVASPGDGVEYSLRRLLFGHGSQPVAAPRLYVNTAKLEEAVTLDPKSLGVTTLVGIAGNSKVKAITLDDVRPSAATLADGSYKLYTPIYLVTNPSSPHAAEAQAFVDFLNTDPAKAVLRKHAVLPYQDGAVLTASDSTRRAAILAEVGARPVADPPTPAPIAAPGATYAAVAAIAPTSATTKSVGQALDAKQDQTNATKATLSVVAAATGTPGSTGSAAMPARASSVGGMLVLAASPTSSGSAAVPAKAGSAAPAAASSVGGKALTGAGAIAATAAGNSPAVAEYTVVKGDTLSGIARDHSVSVADLRQWNKLKNDNLELGQTLRLAAN